MLGDKGADVRVETCPRLTLLHLLLLRSVHHVLLLLPMEIGHLLLLVSSDLLGVHTVRVLHLLVPIIVVCSTATAARPLPAAVIIVTGLVIPATLLRRVLLLRRVIHLRVVHVWPGYKVLDVGIEIAFALEVFVAFAPTPTALLSTTFATFSFSRLSLSRFDFFLLRVHLGRSGSSPWPGNGSQYFARY